MDNGSVSGWSRANLAGRAGRRRWGGGVEVGEGGILRVPVPTPSRASSRSSKSINPIKKCLIKKYFGNWVLRNF